MSSAQKTPIISVSSTRKAIMYSFTRFSIDVPARQDAERHQERRQDDEQHRDAVDAHVVGDAAIQPGDLLDELEARIGGVEADPDQQRDDEGERPSSASATSADVAPRDLAVIRG